MIPIVTAAPGESLFLRACRREPVPATPVWFMRQAGRSLPEYRAVRDRYSMLAACTTADVIAELTLQPLRRLPVDAPYITEAVVTLVKELGATPLIGFAGAPFTLASYLIEGGPSKNHERTRALMYGNPAMWHALLGRLADITIAFLRVQVEAGAAAVQLFDSWVGVLSPGDYAAAVLPHSRRIFDAMAGLGVPRIHFGVGTGELLRLMGEAGADVIGVDWRVGLDEAARRVDAGKALQGNLDPALLLAPWPVLEQRVRQVLEQRRVAEGHVFNLGHGVLPQTDPGALARVTDLVHEVSARAAT